MNHLLAASMVALNVAAPIATAAAAAHDQLVVGMTAFSSSQHPYIDPSSSIAGPSASTAARHLLHAR